MNLDDVLAGAIAHHQAGRLEQAAVGYREVLKKSPRNWQAMTWLGQVHRVRKEFPEAIELSTQAIALESQIPELFFNMGLVMHDMAQHGAALECYEQAIRLRPDYAQAWSNKGLSQKNLLLLKEAAQSLKRAVDIDPAQAGFHSNLANVLCEMGEEQQSLQCHDRALALRPQESSHWMNKARTLAMYRHHELARVCMEKALELQPDSADHLWDYSTNCLIRGDFEQGWRLHEYRWLAPRSGLRPRALNSRLWLGQEPLQGQRIVLYAEQGLGDTLQFCRFVPWVLSLGAEVVLMVPLPLQKLLQDMAWGCEVVVPGQGLQQGDFHCPLMSLPLAFGFDAKHVYGQGPYLAAHPAVVTSWADRLGPPTRPRVGLVWSGGVHQGQADVAAVNRRRNIALQQLAPLLELPLEFHSLQKGEAAEQELRDLQRSATQLNRIHDWSDRLQSFSDTAGLIAQLDLVIGVDTSTVHLAAAMGKPTWLLNRFDSCWRWLAGRMDSPWYPSMRIYQQQAFADWGGAIADLQQDLRTHFQK